MKYFIHTFGCQSNKADSERIAGDYEARGYTQAKSWKTADDIVINTCSVRQSAEDRVRGLLVNIEKYFSGKTKPKIILTGCITHFSESQLLEMFPIVDQVLPINEVGFNTPAIRKDPHHAFIPISTGCNSFCTYCIVPFSRGREVSRPLDDIIAEVHEAVNQGYTEITLLGMNVNSYGLEKVGISLRKMMLSLDKPFAEVELPTNQSQYHTPSGIPPFVHLLRQISQFSQIKQIHFMTSNPWDFHDELIDEIATNPKIDRYLHLAVQSGSNAILKRMNRGYTREDYIRLVTKLKHKVKDIVIGTDIIVGFSGETEADFQQTVELAQLMDWQIAFIGKYSPRPGTAAYKTLPDDVSPAEKKRRWNILEKMINKKHLSHRPRIVK
jgi:tRNA-2-methylthio-N6-dimethylallyladenosine synthase